MYLDDEKISVILQSTPGLAAFSGFLAVQEQQRISEVISSVFARMEDKVTLDDYKAWATLLKPELIKELNDSQVYFGFRDIISRFPTDDFLQSYYKNVK